MREVLSPKLVPLTSAHDEVIDGRLGSLEDRLNQNGNKSLD